jgi:peptide chain release factor 3
VAVALGVVKSADLLVETARRRTFAIISHPDAGKTTLTEKFLLNAGAVVTAGSVKAKAGGRSATSDWMELEQTRGISITSAAMQFEYRGHMFNLLDTPGHKDFSEDTYRVLAAVDAVVMVLDAAKGIEPQTLKLFEVCRSRDLPVITFLNKFDRPSRDPLELLDEIETQIRLRPTPATWPVGDGDDFLGVIDRRRNMFSRFTRTARGATMAPEELMSFDQAAAIGGKAWQRAMDGCDLLEAVGADVDLESFLAGSSTPVYAGSALTDFGVKHLLDAVVELVPPPPPRPDRDGVGRPIDAGTSAFVFKVQANMDKSHRDRLAFARICSGHFERGMTMIIARTGRPFATKYASTVFGAERSTVEEAFPGDVVGFVNATDLRIGDTLYDGDPVTFPGLPSFAPELFTGARPLDTGRSKQFRRGLEVLEEEGVVQVLRDPDMGDSSLVLAAVGQLQFEVFAHRLEAEFNAPVELTGSPYQAIRATDAASAERLKTIGGIRILRRGDGATVALFENKYRLQRLLADEPELTLAPLNAEFS